MNHGPSERFNAATTGETVFCRTPSRETIARSGDLLARKEVSVPANQSASQEMRMRFSPAQSRRQEDEEALVARPAITASKAAGKKASTSRKKSEERTRIRKRRSERKTREKEGAH